MGIDVAWITEGQEPKQEVFDPGQWLTKLSYRWSKLTGTVCLRFIVPWGDAVFNQTQIPVLLEELRSELAMQTDPRFRSHLEKIIRLVEQSVGDSHTYIKFIGD